MTNKNELRNVIEAALLVSETPMTAAKIMDLFPQDARPATQALRAALKQLQQEYQGRGIELRKTGDGYRFWSRDRYAEWLRKLNEIRPPRYSRALLETLAIIAYRQPVSRGDIEVIRGVTVSTGIMRVLLNRAWIKELGKRDVPGHPTIYGTTPAFLAYFSLESLAELPELDEERDLEAIATDFNLQLPLIDAEKKATTDGTNVRDAHASAHAGTEHAHSDALASTNDGADAHEKTPRVEEGAFSHADWDAGEPLEQEV